MIGAEERLRLVSRRDWMIVAWSGSGRTRKSVPSDPSRRVRCDWGCLVPKISLVQCHLVPFQDPVVDGHSLPAIALREGRPTSTTLCLSAASKAETDPLRSARDPDGIGQIQPAILKRAAVGFDLSKTERVKRASVLGTDLHNRDR